VPSPWRSINRWTLGRFCVLYKNAPLWCLSDTDTCDLPGWLIGSHCDEGSLWRGGRSLWTTETSWCRPDGVAPCRDVARRCNAAHDDNDTATAHLPPRCAATHRSIYCFRWGDVTGRGVRTTPWTCAELRMRTDWPCLSNWQMSDYMTHGCLWNWLTAANLTPILTEATKLHLLCKPLVHWYLSDWVFAFLLLTEFVIICYNFLSCMHCLCAKLMNYRTVFNFITRRTGASFAGGRARGQLPPSRNQRFFHDETKDVSGKEQFHTCFIPVGLTRNESS